MYNVDSVRVKKEKVQFLFLYIYVHVWFSHIFLKKKYYVFMHIHVIIILSEAGLIVLNLSDHYNFVQGTHAEKKNSTMDSRLRCTPTLPLFGALHWSRIINNLINFTYFKGLINFKAVIINNKMLSL